MQFNQSSYICSQQLKDSYLPQSDAHLLHFLLISTPMQPLHHFAQMEQQKFILLALIFILVFLSVVSASTSQLHCPDSGASTEVRAGFWLPSSSHYSPVNSIDTTLYTHLYYSYLSINEDYTIVLPSTDKSSPLATFSSIVKSTENPAVKTILSIGTDEYKLDVSNAAFSRMAADKNLREVFINSSIELARANGFDGLDLAWSFPATKQDMANLGDLLADWRVKIMEESKNTMSKALLLTATLSFSSHLFDMPDSNLDYPIDDISTNLDWANVLTFGFKKNSNITSADAPLYDISSHFSASYGVISWLDAGIPPCKLVIGIPLFGRSWFLRNKTKNGVGAPTVAAGTKQKKSNQTGIIAFVEIEELLKFHSTVETYDNQSVAEYLSDGDLWVSFDSARVVEEKIRFVGRYQLLGYFLMTISFDDSNCTISKQASKSWHQYIDSLNAQGRFGTMKAGATNQDQNSSASSPGSWYSKTICYVLSTIFLMVILFQQELM